MSDVNDFLRMPNWYPVLAGHTFLTSFVKMRSDVIAALQSKVGVEADRYFGPNTCRALQRYLGTEQDGVLSRPSACVREMQRRLNSNTF
mgnify:CR=1 FL=1